jgi:hypothetical protein
MAILIAKNLINCLEVSDRAERHDMVMLKKGVNERVALNASIVAKGRY